MKRTLFAFLCTVLCLVSVVCQAAEPQQGKIRVLLLTGGHGFDADPFFAMFDAMDDVEYTKAEMPAQADLLGPAATEKFDVLVFYDMCREITPVQQEQFVALLNKGIGVVALHHTLGGHQTWPEYEKIIGGRFFLKPREVDGKTLPKSGWKHGETLDVTVADKQHPITRGLADFTIHDETYNNYSTVSDAKVLLTTDNPTNDPELAWVKSYGNSRVMYLMLGHDRLAYENENYRTLVSRGIRWAACRPTDPAAEWKPLFNGRDMTGWEQVGGSHWEVKDGLLIGRQGEGNAPGDLFSTESFDDFELRVNYRMVWPGNSGVWYRYQAANKTFQADILEYKKPFALTGTLYCPGKMFLTINTDASKFDREGFNTLVIRAAGRRQMIFLNGHLVGDVYDDTSDRGKVGFQIHAGAQFGDMQIQVREIAIRPL